MANVTMEIKLKNFFIIAEAAIIKMRTLLISFEA